MIINGVGIDLAAFRIDQCMSYPNHGKNIIQFRRRRCLFIDTVTQHQPYYWREARQALNYRRYLPNDSHLAFQIDRGAGGVHKRVQWRADL